MAEKGSIKKNLAYQAFYEVFAIILPLLTSPYIARVIGAEGLGVFSYTYSIAYYFQLFGMLGIKFYGNRSIAQVRDDKDKTNTVYSEILIIHILLSIISFVIYIIYSVFIAKYEFYSLIQSIMVIAALFDVSWLFFGLEEFKTTVTRNTIIKVFSVASIFLFVHKKEDLWIYILIMAMSQLLGNLLLFIMARKYVNFSLPQFNQLSKHLKPLLILFIPVISTSIFKYMDKIMLGAIGDEVELGFYENAEKILNIPLGIIISFGSVMLPKMSNLVANRDDKASEKYISMSIRYMGCVSIAMAFGMASIGINFAPIFWGNEFAKAGYIIMLLAVSLPFTTVANIVRNQDLIPNGKDKYYSLAIIIGAVSNLVINFCLIPTLQSFGVAIGTIVSEILVCIVQMFMADKNNNYKSSILNASGFMIPGILMFITVYGIGKIVNGTIVSLLVQIFLGIIVYSISTLLYFMIIKDEIYIKIKRFLSK